LYDIKEAIGVLQDMKNSWLPCAYMGMSPQKYGRPEIFAGTDEGKELIKSMRQGFEKDQMPMLLDHHLNGLLEKGGDK
jgi:hypothetical protein